MDAWVLGEIMIKLLQKGKGFRLEKIITPIGLKLEKKDEKKEEKVPEVKYEMKEVGTNWASALRKFENATKDGKSKGKKGKNTGNTDKIDKPCFKHFKDGHCPDGKACIQS